MSDDPGIDLVRLAWQRYCATLARLGDEILTDAYPRSERESVEGFRHLATQVAGWTNWAVGHADAEHPAFFRQNDLVMRWGGPNVDQVTRRARVVPEGVYRVSGLLGSCDDFILTLKDGDMHAGRYGIAHEVMGSELGYARGDRVDIVVSASRPADLDPTTRWIELPVSATLLNIREYYWTWAPEPPAVFVVERLDTQGSATAPISAPDLDAALADAEELITSSIYYWNLWVENERSQVPSNEMAPPSGAAGGSSRLRYSFGFFDLESDEALIIETDPAGARYHDIQLYSLGWFESLDFANRTTSLNHTQTHTSSDGLIRTVIAHQDPGVPNWLDSEGRRRGMVTQRWILAGSAPSAIARRVRHADLRDELPADTPQVSAEQRAEEIRRRQSHVAWRYRT